MRFRGRKLVFLAVGALALVQVVAIAPAFAATAPAAPAMPTASPGSLQARVTWAAPADNGSPISQYTVTPFVGTVAGTPRVFNNTLVTEVITGLVNGTTYTFKVKAHNAIGTGLDSVASFAVMVGAPVAPAAPTAAPGAASARVTWVAPANNGAAINQYVVTPFIGLTAGTPRVFNNTLVTEVITGLVNGTTYTFKVKAHNARGAGPNSVGSKPITVGAPVAPATPQVALGNAQVRVNWVAPANNGAAVTGYVVTPFIGLVAQTARVFNTAGLAENVTGLVDGTSYTFKVAAKNARGTGPTSLTSAAIAPTAQPTLRAVMNATIGQPILVNSAGMTVYMFVPDAAGTTSHVSGPLRTAWPYVTWAGTLTVGAGLTAANATANLQPDNSRLIGYHGHLLYTFVGDAAPGDATGQGLAQFFVLDASGNKITPPA